MYISEYWDRMTITRSDMSLKTKKSMEAIDIIAELVIYYYH